MDIRFCAESPAFHVSRGGLLWDDAMKNAASPHFLRGFSCPEIDDSSGPADEGKYLSVDHIWTIERVPLRTSVRVVSEAAWGREIDRIYKSGERYKPWSDDLLAAAATLAKDFAQKDWAEELHAETGVVLTDVSPEDLLAATFARRASNSHARVFYSPAVTDHSFRADRQDAIVQITLRLDAEAMEHWNALWTHRSSSRPLSCTIMVGDLRFSENDRHAAFSGLPTWPSFIEGRYEARAEMFQLSVDRGAARQEFDD